MYNLYFFIMYNYENLLHVMFCSYYKGAIITKNEKLVIAVQCD